VKPAGGSGMHSSVAVEATATVEPSAPGRLVHGAVCEAVR
jgi:hypothetical protein